MEDDILYLINEYSFSIQIKASVIELLPTLSLPCLPLLLLLVKISLAGFKGDDVRRFGEIYLFSALVSTRNSTTQDSHRLSITQSIPHAAGFRLELAPLLLWNTIRRTPQSRK